MCAKSCLYLILSLWFPLVINSWKILRTSHSILSSGRYLKNFDKLIFVLILLISLKELCERSDVAVHLQSFINDNLILCGPSTFVISPYWKKASYVNMGRDVFTLLIDWLRLRLWHNQLCLNAGIKWPMPDISCCLNRSIKSI